MINKISIILLAVLLFSCSKKIEENQTVTYKVKCESCLVYIEDNVWNRYNELERSKNHHFQVNGYFEYTFVNTKLDSVSAKFYVDVFHPNQVIESSITSGSKSVKMKEIFGFFFDGKKFYDKTDTTIHLKLK